LTIGKETRQNRLDRDKYFLYSNTQDSLIILNLKGLYIIWYEAKLPSRERDDNLAFFIF